MKISSKWFNIIIFHFIFAVLSFFIPGLNDSVAGVIYLLSVIPLIICLIKYKKMFTPIMPAVLFDVSFGVYLFHLVSNEYIMGTTAKIFVSACILLWELISAYSFKYIKENESLIIQRVKVNNYSFKIIVGILFLIATTSMLFEWKMAGGIPIFRADQETFRFAVRYNSLTHIAAIMNKVIVILIGAYFVNKDKISIKRDFLMIFAMMISELLMIGTAMRGEMIFGLAIVFIVYGIKRKIPKKFYILAIIVVVVVVGVVPIIRMTNLYGTNYMMSITDITKYSKFAYLTPLLQTFTCNFSILALDITIFPSIVNFGFGSYKLLPAIPFLDLGNNVAVVQNNIINNGFYSGLTATFLAPWYADFGYIGMLIGTVIAACWTNFVFKQYMRKRDMFSLLWYAYTFYASLWLLYSGTFDIVYVIYCTVIYCVFRVKVKN